MAQGAGLVNVIPKNNKGFFDSAGAAQLGDGATTFNVTPRTAADLALASCLQAATDVKILSTDFTDFVTGLESKSRG